MAELSRSQRSYSTQGQNFTYYLAFEETVSPHLILDYDERKGDGF